MKKSELSNGVRIASLRGNGNRSNVSIGIFMRLGSRTVENERETEMLGMFEEGCEREARESERRMRVTSGRECTTMTVETVAEEAADAFREMIDIFWRRKIQGGNGGGGEEEGGRESPMTTPEIAVEEMIHEVAFGGEKTGLGRRTPRCSIGRSGRGNAPKGEEMEGFVREVVRKPEAREVVIAGVGIEHGDLERLSREFPEITRLGTRRRTRKEEGEGKYDGGEKVIEAERKEPKLKGPKAHLAHIGVCIESPSLVSEGQWAAMVGGSILGGGAAFSEGGPGKGMHSRLMRTMLSEAGVERAVAIRSGQSDTGVFGIVGACEGEVVREVVKGMAMQVAGLAAGAGGITEEEVERAKAGLKATIGISLEQGVEQCEDIGKQLCLRGRWDGATELGAKIDGVRAEDVARVIRSGIVQKKPTIVGIIPRQFVRTIPRVDELHRMMMMGVI